jgi:hypothetical protein
MIARGTRVRWTGPTAARVPLEHTGHVVASLPAGKMLRIQFTPDDIPPGMQHRYWYFGHPKETHDLVVVWTGMAYWAPRASQVEEVVA